MYRRVKRIFLPKCKTLFISVGIVLGCIFILFFVSNTLITLGKHGLTPGNIYSIIFSQGVRLNSTNDRINVLLLGIGGNGHEGGDLTDSMLILSLNNTTHSMALVSIPRDVWSDTLKDKVNTAYHYGEEKSERGGLLLARTITEEITGIPIQYSVVFDFSVFSDAVDFVGGIDVLITTPFTDTEYPIAGKENDDCGGDPLLLCRYKTVSFKQGMIHMDGIKALEYVRSRHAEGSEGTDFARSRRQQEVLLAIRLKAMNVSEWFGMIKRSGLVEKMGEKTKTDMTVSEILSYGKIISKINTNTIKKISIEQLFENPPEEEFDGKYVLIPVDNYSSVYDYITNSINK